jgi:DNA-binding winged helix-turn-helix (wHTH) protein/tetratricopeptide (TPR) repeat protein
MQVLLALTDANSAVLTRDDLMRSCWPGMFVGDDAVSRTIAEIRRVARATGAGFVVETIPRIGYRLVAAGVTPESPSAPLPSSPSRTTSAESAPEVPASQSPSAPPSDKRRRWILIAGAAVAAGAYGVWRSRPPLPPARYTQLLEQAAQAMRINLPADRTRAIQLMEEATALFPSGAAAWGLLAIARFQIADSAPQLQTTQLTQACEAAISRALALDPREPNALAARILLGRKLDDWYVTEQRLRGLLAMAPQNPIALDQLTAQLQAAGYIAESNTINERALSFDRLRPTPLARKALKLWIMGEPGEADRFAAAALDLHPGHPLILNSRLLVFAFTERWQAARLFIDALPPGNLMFPPALRAAWKTWIDALEGRTAADITSGREAALSVAPTSPAAAVHAIMVLSALGQLDPVYQIIDGLLLRRGDVVAKPGGNLPVTIANDTSWMNTQWLFTPATRPLRMDPRFGPLCDAIRLSRYWRQRGVGPDERRTTGSGST